MTTSNRLPVGRNAVVISPMSCGRFSASLCAGMTTEISGTKPRAFMDLSRTLERERIASLPKARKREMGGAWWEMLWPASRPCHDFDRRSPKHQETCSHQSGSVGSPATTRRPLSLLHHQFAVHHHPVAGKGT